MTWKILFVTLFAVGAFAQIENPMQRYEEVLNRHCQQNGAQDKVAEVKQAITAFGECAKNLFNVETIRREIEEAKPHGELDEVFKKYCVKAPELKTCFNTMLEGVAPCVDASVRNHMDDIKNGTSQLLDFICYKDGDRIALFYAEGGPECITSKVEQIQECAKKLRDEVPSVEVAKAMGIEEQCKKYDELTACVVTELEKCETPTPGNMAESLFRYVRNSSPCPKK